jgi:CRISPR-associated exonuclease Cas4
VELKTRSIPRAYLSDVIELSAQRLALEAQTGEWVDDCAYVVVQVSRRAVKIPRMVRLLAREEVIGLANKRELIVAGAVAPRYTRTTALCAHCAFRRECRPAEPR